MCKKKNGQQIHTLIDDNGVEIKVRDDVMTRIIDEKKNQTGLPFHVNNIVNLFYLSMNHVSMPEFSKYEIYIIDDCMDGRVIDDTFVKTLNTKVEGRLHLVDEGDYFSYKPVLSEEDTAFVTKIGTLDYLQRIKLIYTICQESFGIPDKEIPF